jgi:hypothetical protein
LISFPGWPDLYCHGASLPFLWGAASGGASWVLLSGVGLGLLAWTLQGIVVQTLWFWFLGR